MTRVRNLAAVQSKLDVWVKQVERTTTREFRNACGSLFMELLKTTPQWSGRAVANWKVGVGAPDMSWEADVGDPAPEKQRKDGTSYRATYSTRQTGDAYWIDYAWTMNKVIISRLRLGDKVYFSNNVQGDNDQDGADVGSAHYLADLQDQSYWSKKLRLVNMPYQTAAETLLIHNWGTFADGGGTHLGMHV